MVLPMVAIDIRSINSFRINEFSVSGETTRDIKSAQVMTSEATTKVSQSCALAVASVTWCDPPPSSLQKAMKTNNEIALKSKSQRTAKGLLLQNRLENPTWPTVIRSEDFRSQEMRTDRSGSSSTQGTIQSSPHRQSTNRFSRTGSLEEATRAFAAFSFVELLPVAENLTPRCWRSRRDCRS